MAPGAWTHDGREVVATSYYSAIDPDHLPPLGVKVRLRWGARPEIEAVLMPDNRGVRSPSQVFLGAKRVCWGLVDGGRTVLLPNLEAPPDPRHPHIGWHTLQGWPDWWRPLRPDLWLAPLPPVGWIDTGATRAGRRWSATMRFGAVDDAEASDLGREMEDNREAARALAESGGGDGADADAGANRWWVDPFAVTYSAPGQITRHEAEGRLMRAFNAEHWVRVERPVVKTFAEALDRYARTRAPSAAELAADDPIIMRLEPSGRDRDDMLTALGWLKGLDTASGRLAERESRGATQELVLRLRERDPPLSWRRIGKIAGCSHETARQLYETGLDRITATANGETTVGSWDTAERLAGVQTANRAWRRGR